MQLLIDTELEVAGIERPDLVIGAWAIPTILEHGTDAQRERFVAPTLAGDIVWCQLFSEPEAGSDLASLKTRAVRDGDHYIVNGQKIFTTGGHDADYIWLAVRTDREAPKHKGISILIVDTSDPGFTWTPIITADGAHHVNATYYQDVRVPVSMRVGEEGGGWKLITTQLNHERVMRGTSQSHPRCIALDADIGRYSRCTIHDRRPSVCAAVPASLEVGQRSAQCDKSRLAHGLHALTEADWIGVSDIERNPLPAD